MSLGIIQTPACPKATLDVALNLKNRQKCIDVVAAGYEGFRFSSQGGAAAA